MENLTLIGDVAGEFCQEFEGIGSLAARGRSGRLVGVIGDGTLLFIVLHAAECYGVSGTVPSKPYGELLVVCGGPDGVMYVEPRVRQASMP